MKCAAKKLRPPIKTHGGKAYLARRIIALMPTCKTYLEPFAGGLSVLLNRPRVETEIVGDLNQAVAIFWQVIADEELFARMFDRLRFQTSRKRGALNREGLERAFLLGKEYVEHPPCPLSVIDRAEFAAFFLMRNRLSRGGLGETFAWSDRLRGGQPGDLNSWCTMMDSELQRVHQRVKGVTVKHANALDLIGNDDGPEALIYCDPPYVHATRTVRDAYDVEMTDEDHRDLLGFLRGCQGKIFISGYGCPLYWGLLHDWKRTDFDLPNHSGQGKMKERRIECLWENQS